MTTPYICLRCRHNLPSRIFQLRSSSFVSLGRLVKKDVKSLDPGSFDALQASAQPVKQEDKEELAAAELAQMEIKNSQAIPRKDRSKQWGTDKAKRQPRPQRDPLENLFASNLHKNYAAAQEAIVSTTPPARQLVEEDIASIAHRYHKREESIEQIWHQCSSLMRSKHWQTLKQEQGGHDMGFSDEQLSLFRNVLLGITHAWGRHPRRTSTPSPSAIVIQYVKHDIMRYWWDKLLWRQLGPNIVRGLWSTSSTPNHNRNSFQESTLILNDITRVWSYFFNAFGEPSEGRNRWRGIPSATQISSSSQISSKDIAERFPVLFPRHSAPRVNRMCMAAIMTYDLFERRKAQAGASDHLLNDAEPLVQALKQLVQGCSIRTEDAIAYLEEERIPSSTGASILHRWRALGIDVVEERSSSAAAIDPDLQDSALQRNHDHVDEVIGPASTLDHAWKIPSPESTHDRALKELGIQLLRARREGDAVSIDDLWKQCQDLLSSQKAESEQSDILFGNFLTSFFAVRLQHRAVQVWNFMIKTNHQPTQYHWHAMIEGCSTAKDLVSLREIWANMITAGVKPRTYLYTSWIQGLMRCGAWREGVEALNVLGKLWKSDPSNEDLRPSLSPINATLSGIVDWQQTDLISKIHAFIKAHNLNYDTSTYNILLRPVIRAGDDAAVQRLFTEMRANNRNPDIATFTIILNGLLSNPSSAFQDRTPTEQQAEVFNILADMEKSGLQANIKTYSTILDGLLNERIFNVEAATAVMERMAANGVKASPHVYTILITHYFSLTPPDLSAISDLLKRAKREKVYLDHIFYGRMIENYARVGEPEKMLMILRRMPEEGKSPGWLALLACLRALVQAEEWEAVRDLVKDVEDEGGLFRHGHGAWRGKDAFWELLEEVKGMGVLDDG